MGDGRQVDAVLVDWGGVLTVPVPAFVDDWLRVDRIDRERYHVTMSDWLHSGSGPVADLETGVLSVAEFEHLLAAELVTLDGGQVHAPGLLTRMFGTAHTDPAMVGLVRDLRAAGVHTVLLSNSWGEDGYPVTLLTELFDTLVISARVGLRKPDRAIFDHTLDLVGLPADRCVFVDDMPANVDAARALGLHAHRHTTADDTRAALARLGVVA
ncbi:hypothetical protein GCM10022243_56830 [Saccharothrix violaceirubra]|uniref:Putative hydrolase of the HAD superfamily n=1 Tax=Saccharothrix violaceirubra TaxID=413306 RepID=A0A7W7T3L9_9PSEU|nr:HAD family phosphatase [Saccharothrix violaceirubra]MBB4965886.1 putative hydrolase of the HAD superfamily [Saccharothrix violaceirubra]